MSTNPVTGGAQQPHLPDLEPIVPAAQPASTPAAPTGLQLHLDFGFSRPTLERLGIGAPASGSGTSILVAQVLAENEKLRLDNESARNSSLSARVRSAIAKDASAAGTLGKLEADAAALEAQLSTVLAQRSDLQTARAAKVNAGSVLATQISARQNEINAHTATIVRLEQALARLDEDEDFNARDALQAEIDTYEAELTGLQADLAALEDAADADATDNLGTLIDAVDSSLAGVAAALAALGEDGDPQVEAQLLAEQELLAALQAALTEELAGLDADPGAGAAQTLAAFAAAVRTAAQQLEEGRHNTEAGADVIVLDIQINALGSLATAAEARLTALTEPAEGESEIAPDPGAREGLRMAGELLFGAASAIAGQIAAAAGVPEHAAANTLQASIDDLEAAIAALEAEQAELAPDTSPDVADAYAADIAALQGWVALLEEERSALPDPTDLSAAEQVQAQIDALGAASDAVSIAFQESTASQQVRELVQGATARFAESVTLLNGDLLNLGNEQFLADQQAMLTGRSASLDALTGLIAPLEARVVALGDETIAARRGEIEARIAVVMDTVAALEAELDSLDPEHPGAERQLLEMQRDAAVAAMNATAAAHGDFVAQQTQLNGEIAALDVEISALNNSIATINTELAKKEATFNGATTKTTASSTETGVLGNQMINNLTSFLLDDLVIGKILEEMGANDRIASRPVLWGVTAEELATQYQDNETDRRATAYGEVIPPDVKRNVARKAEQLALTVAAALDALSSLDVAAQPAGKGNTRLRLDL